VFPLRLPSDAQEVLCLGAHCDDIEIGCGGALIELMRTHPTVRVQWIVFSSNDVRAAETRDAARRIAGSRISVEVCNFRNGYFPYVGAAIKDYFEALKSRVRPDLVFTHWLSDRHQDHRTISELTWNSFRDHWILEYEIAKYEGDLGHPNVFLPLAEDAARSKVSVLRESFVSQHDKQWFSDETFWAMLRLRGIECNAPSGYAEAFHSRKTILSLA
jgi:LmbE family N-acetylglucosaminyl deacetylase